VDRFPRTEPLSVARHRLLCAMQALRPRKRRVP
jgi:hypothetical protein